MSPFVDWAPQTITLPPNPWWQCLLPDASASIRLWCFPVAGAGAALWHPWIAPLNGAAEMMSVCLPGRETRLHEAPLTTLASVVDQFVAEVEPWVDERDVYCGHGMGALLAFEVARRLRQRGAPGPRGLILCNVAAPHLPRLLPALHRLSPREFLAAVEARYGPVPNEFRDRPEVLDLLLPALRADLEIEETYRYVSGPPLDIPLLTMGGRHDPLVRAPLRSGWRVHTTSRFESAEIEGGHFLVTDEAGAAAARIRRFLSTL